MKLFLWHCSGKVRNLSVLLMLAVKSERAVVDEWKSHTSYVFGFLFLTRKSLRIHSVANGFFSYIRWCAGVRFAGKALF